MAPGADPRILIAGVDWLGDALFMTPVFRAIKRRWPGAYVAVSSAPRNQEALERCPDLDEVIAFDEAPFLLGLGAQEELRRRYRFGRFDTALLLHRSFVRALAAFRAGIPRRIGFSHPKRDWLLTERLDPPSSSLHRIDAYLSILRPLGIADAERTPRLSPRPEDLTDWRSLRSARTGWTENEKMLVLHPGGNWDLKRWPAERFERTAQQAVREGWKVAVCGSRHEAHLGERIAASRSGGDVVSFCGATKFGGLVGMLASARLVISNDSGPLHVAAALGTPTLGLFGPTLPALTGPVASAASRTIHQDFGCELPCLFKRCSDRVCMDRLSPEEVWNVARQVAGDGVS